MPEKQTTKAEKKAIQPDMKNRRLLIGGILASAVAISLAPEIVTSINQPPSVGSNDAEIPSYLKDLDKRIPAHPALLLDHAPVIADLTMQEFCRQTSTPTPDLKQSIHFSSSQDDFHQYFDEIYPCSDTELAIKSIRVAATGSDRKIMVVNLVEFLENFNLRSRAASLLNEVTAHEWGHFFALLRDAIATERVPLTNRLVQPGSKKLGLNFLEPIEDLAKGDRICRLPAAEPGVIDEASVQYQAQRILAGQQYFDYRPVGYTNYRAPYQKAVVDYVGEEFPALFSTHQNSDNKGFFTFIGQKMRAKHPHLAEYSPDDTAEYKIAQAFGLKIPSHLRPW